jgi:hypothetical protein
MSYDEWEAVRLVKCVAALKLMRRCPPLFASLATCGLTRAAQSSLVRTLDAPRAALIRVTANGALLSFFTNTHTRARGRGFSKRCAGYGTTVSVKSFPSPPS